MMKRFLKTLLIILCILCVSFTSDAHSGRTDGNGGHRDNKNKSGLGSYHYHHGYPAHLHDNGCPYLDSDAGSSRTVAPPKPSISISATPAKLYVGDNYGLTYTIENATSSDSTIESSDETIIHVNDDNSLSALKEGTATITITGSGISKSFDITVAPVLVTGVEIKNPVPELEVTKTLQLQAILSPDNATDKTITWISQNPDIVSIDSNGNLTPKKDGTATIICQASNNISTEFKIAIYHVPVESITIDDSKQIYISENKIDVEEAITPDAKIFPNDATYKDITWETSDPDIISIENGEFKINGVGNVTLTARASDNVTSEIKLEIVEPFSSSTAVGAVAIAAIGGFLYRRKKKKA